MSPGGRSIGGARWRLIVDGADDGASNMAVDEAMLESYVRGPAAPGPTLRLYSWAPATLSLGRAQRAEGAYDADVVRREGIGVVRRPSGGTAVLHEFDRTYAVVGALGVPPFTGGVIATYKAIADALASALARLGVAASPVTPHRGSRRDAGAACFANVGAWEIAVNGCKLIGSAQARRRGAFLQHGSIPLRCDPGRLEDVLGSRVDRSRFIDLERASGVAPDVAVFDAACVGAFEETFCVTLLPGTLTESEELRAAELRCWKYDSMAWTHGGAIGSREARWGPPVAR